MSNMTRHIPEIPHAHNIGDTETRNVVEAITNAWRYRNGDHDQAFITKKDATNLINAISNSKISDLTSSSGDGGVTGVTTTLALKDNQYMPISTDKTIKFGWNSSAAFEFRNGTRMAGAIHSTTGVYYAYDGTHGSQYSYNLDLGGAGDPLFNMYGGGTRTGTPGVPGTVAKWIKCQLDGVLYYIPLSQ